MQICWLIGAIQAIKNTSGLYKLILKGFLKCLKHFPEKINIRLINIISVLADLGILSSSSDSSSSSSSTLAEICSPITISQFVLNSVKAVYDDLKPTRYIWSQLSINRQEDSSEFLSNFIEELQELSIFNNDNAGCLDISSTVCRDCGNASTVRENTQSSDFVYKSLSIDSINSKISDLQSLWNANSDQTEFLEESLCQECKNANKSKIINRKIIIQSRFLALSTPLFIYSKQHKKSKRKAAYCVSDVNSLLSINGNNYKLISAVFHEGTAINQGHYYTVTEKNYLMML